jgi:hypothetical protein
MSTELPPLPTPSTPTGLSCASCGGTVEVREGWTNVSCQFCETPLAVVGKRGVERLMVLERIDRQTAAQALADWFRRGIRKAPGLSRHARIEESFLAWFPFVRTRFDVIGWVLGAKKERVKRGDRWETVERPVEHQVVHPVDQTIPASEMAEFGVHRINLAGDQLLPLDEELLRSRGMLFPPSLSLQEVAEKLFARALEEVKDQPDIDRVTFSWLDSVRRRDTLIHYPLWVLRYTYKDRSYQVLIDAEDGSLAYGKAPGNHLYRACALVFACAGACFLGTTILQNFGWLLDLDHGLEALGVVGLVLAGLVAWGYSQFRHGGVIEEGTGLIKERRHKSLAAFMKQTVKEL